MVLFISALMKVIYPPAASIFITVMSVLSFVCTSNAGWMEFKGKNGQYSKFIIIASNENENHDKKKKKPKVVPSKLGMVVSYTPAFVAGVLSFFLFSTGADDHLRFTLLQSAVAAHFFKRVLEVMFVHKYSGSMNFGDMIIISLMYFAFSTTIIYTQSLTTSLPEPVIDLKYVGVSMFLLGICGNFYHHYLLTKLRTKGEKQYKIPQGGLFNLVICPHYLFEIIVFWGLCCISQTLYALSYTLGTTFYLMGRSYSTRKWYQSKFEDFPKDVKALIPYIF